eukprot:jgi/Ulvmu1/2154/UM129_0014.1
MAKKSKKDKVAETAEDRMARLKKEANELEERAKIQMEASRASLQARRDREQQYSKLNSIKIHNQWRKIMRMAKVDELRGQIEILSQNHEREVDRKDAIIQMLDRDLDDAEAQFETAVQGNLQVIERLLDLQYQRMKALDEDFNRKLTALDEEAGAERSEMAAAHARHKKDMNDVIMAMQTQFTELEGDLRQDYEAAREEIKNKNTEDFNVMKITLESNIDDLEKKFEVSHDAYLMQTSEHMATFTALTKTDAQAAHLIDMRLRKLQRLQDQLKHWRTKIHTVSMEWGDRNAALLTEKRIMAGHYQGLKSAMDSFRAVQGERLKQLSLQAQTAERELTAVIQHAERILKLAEMCRKLETEQEKILPFVPVSQAVTVPEEEPSPLDDVEAELRRFHLQRRSTDGTEAERPADTAGSGRTTGLAASDDPGQASDSPQPHSAASAGVSGAPAGDVGERKGAAALPAGEAAALGKESGGLIGALMGPPTNDGSSCRGLHPDGSIVQDWEYFDNFYKRYNKVLVDTVAVEREEARLEQENADLRTILKQYLDGISVNEDVMNNPLNPLMVVNNRLQLILQQRDKARAAALQQVM